MGSFASVLPSLASIGSAVSTVGGGLSLISFLSRIGSAGAEVAATQADVNAAERQAIFLEQQAATEKAQSEAEARQDRRRSLRILSKQQNLQAAAGISTTSGTSLAQLIDSTQEAELNALNIEHRGTLRSRSTRIQADQIRGRIPGLILSGTARGLGALGGFIR